MAKKEVKELSVVEMLMDENNRDNIVLLDAEQNEVEFEQVAVIPHNENIYAVLKPVEPIEGVADDEALVFGIEEIDGEDCLVICEDDKIIDAVRRLQLHP